ncbi:MFS transporter [Zafaria cholistanensis]|uniref:MFS transporter n=1 Tax=Zafaria cholistanensis TaxID=1682741 RepID=A0A5A7NPM1_9MICC|nr:MFS transporter [Zafaria cholistanensis]GER22506.1 MFS transporter [Zafaria cholistanensis]
MTSGEFKLRDLGFSVYGPSLLYSVGTGAILPVIALSARGLGATVATATLAITLIGIGSLLTNVPASVLTARFGERAAMIGAAAWATCGMGLALAAPVLALPALAVPPLGVFAAGILMIGMAGAVFNLARQSYLAEAVPVRFRARAMSTLGGVSRIGTFIGPFVSAAAMVWLGLPGAYWTGMAAMAAAAVVSLRIPDLAGGGRPAAGNGAVRPTIRSIAVSRARILATLGLGVLLISAVRATRQAVIPLWSEQLGLDAPTASVIYGLSGAVDMLVFYPAGKLMDRKGRVAVAVPAMVVMGAALALLPLTAQAWTLLAVAMLLGFGNGIGSGIVMTLGADFSPRQGRPQFLGLWRLLSDAGVMGGPVVLAAMTGAVSLASGIWTVAALSFAGAAIFGYFIPRTPRSG